MKYTVQVMTTHRGMRIIHKGKNTDWTDGLYHLVMDYLDKKMKLGSNLRMHARRLTRARMMTHPGLF